MFLRYDPNFLDTWEGRGERKGVCEEIDAGWDTHEKKAVCIVFERRM